MTFITLYLRNLRQFPRIPTVLVFGIMMPVIQLLLFGSIFSATTELPGHPYHGLNYYTYILPAIILLTAFLGMANSSAAFIVDLRTGYFDKLRTTPASPASVIAARLLAEMTRVTGQATLIFLIALLPGLGARTATGFLGAVVMVLAAVIFSTMVSGLFAMALAMKTRSDQATQSAFPLFFILLFLSTAYMPQELLPDWLGTAVLFNPIDYMIQGLRSLMFDGWADALPNLAIGLGFGALVGAALATLNWRIYRGMLG